MNAEAANLCSYNVAQAEDSFYMSIFHLKLLITQALLIIEITFTSSVQALMPDSAGLVCEESEQSLVYHVLNFISTVCFQ